MFGKSKTLAQKAEEDKARLQIKAYKVANENMDRQMITARRQKMEEMRRLQA